MTLSYQEYLIIKQYLDKNEDSTFTSIANNIDADQVIPRLSQRTLRRYVSLIDSGDIEIEKPVDAVANTTVNPYLGAEDYHFKYSNNTYTFSQESVDSVFCAYSRSGLNYTREQIISALKISENEFNAISSGKYYIGKNTSDVKQIYLFKDKIPFGPETAALDQAIIDRRLKYLTSKLIEVFINNDNPVITSIIRKYKKEVVNLNMESSKQAKLISDLNNNLEAISVKFYKNYTPVTKDKVAYVVITDQHIGMEADNFNSKIAEKAFKRIASYLNTEYSDYSINLLLLGDLIHSVSGKNHEDTWKTLENGMWGANSIITPFELLLNFIHSVPTITGVYAVGGNHSRLSASRKDESSDEGEKLIFYMLDRVLNVPVVFDPDITKLKDNKYLNFILLHGDRTADKQSGESIAWKHGDPNKFNLILLGHTHSRHISKYDDSINYRKMVCPAFCPSDSYADSLGFQTLAGFVVITEVDEKPHVVDIPLNYDKIIKENE